VGCQRALPYPPDKRIRIVNILGMEEEAVSPGALEFTQTGAHGISIPCLSGPVISSCSSCSPTPPAARRPTAAASSTSPAGRGQRVVDFNKAYNPPCALNDFATCPLPPPQNRLKLRIDAGELKYVGGPTHHAATNLQ
jgi:hypothetical protein